MNLQDEIWETIRNEVAYLNGFRLAGLNGDLAKQVADNLAPYMESVLAQAWHQGFRSQDSRNPYRRDRCVTRSIQPRSWS